MRFIDDAARINHQNWNEDGKYENDYGAQTVLHVNREGFRAFLEGSVERLPPPVRSVQRSASVGVLRTAAGLITRFMMLSRKLTGEATKAEPRSRGENQE